MSIARQGAAVLWGAASGRRPVIGPLHAQIGVADPCNHRCVMCWDHPPVDRVDAGTALRFAGFREGLMPFDQFRSIVDDLYRLGTRRIDLVGRGEPTLNKHIAEMVEFAKSRSMYVTMTTNGSRLDLELAQRFVSADLDRLKISLNAGTPETYPRVHQTETPERYLAVKARLINLVQEKRRQGKSSPLLTLSFVISSINFHEVQQMVEVAHEIGADNVSMVHVVTREASDDLCLAPAQYRRLIQLLAKAQKRAVELGIETNIPTLAATLPTYFEKNEGRAEPRPCYVGWYFSLILANGAVLPCCQCTSPLGTVKEKSFAELWSSDRYQKFRTAARQLPRANPLVASCECDRCMLRVRNESIDRILHPVRSLGRKSEAEFTLRDVFRMRKLDTQDFDIDAVADPEEPVVAGR
ncbi:MAG: radical SAM protein [Chloroflexi bacterium]|nr:radical SAM protein [Chloroflexota bacterium]